MEEDRRISLLKEVEKWSSAHAHTIWEVAQGQIEKAWTQIADALARTQFNAPLRPSDWRSCLCGPRENGRREGVQAKWPRSDHLELQRGPLATAPTPMKKLLCRITEELPEGKARRAVPPRSIPREIWLIMLCPRDSDIQKQTDRL